MAPQTATYTLTGLNLPTGQNVLIRARGYYRTGYQNGSESIEEMVKVVFLGGSVSGRIVAPSGRGVKGAVVTLTPTTGPTRQVSSGPLGFYRFDDLDLGQSYTVSVSNRRFTFAPRTVFVTGNMTGIDFVGQ